MRSERQVEGFAHVNEDKVEELLNSSVKVRYIGGVEGGE